MKKHLRSTVCLLLVVLFCVSSFAFESSAANNYFQNSPQILNNTKLYPRKTGFIDIDNKIANLLNSLRPNCATTADLVQASYDWLVNNLSYKLGTYYPYYDYSSRSEIPIPFYVLYFSYCPFTEKTGVCDNFSCAFMLIMRAIGFDAYIRPGKMYTSSQTYDHVWVEVKINGRGYIFDPQADNSVKKSKGYNKHIYYCAPVDEMRSTYVKNESLCAAYDAATIPVSETKNAYCFVGVSSSYGGTVTTNAQSSKSVQTAARRAHFSNKNYGYKFTGWLAETAACRIGATVTVTANPKSGYSFLGWYIGPTLVSTNTTYSFTAYSDANIEALFSGERFADVPYGSWYYESVYNCFRNGVMSGTTTIKFTPNGNLTRAMAVTILAKLSGESVASYTKKSFWDVDSNAYYAKAVEWAYSKGITSGNGNGFGPNSVLTREQLAVFLYKYAAYKKSNITVRKDITSYSDYWSIHSWARDAMSWAVGSGLISGYSGNKLAPCDATTRAQAAVIFSNMIIN